MKIRTNNKPRPIIYGSELPQSVLTDFDYLGDDLPSAQFFKFKGQYYDIGEFMRVDADGPYKGWHGYSGESFFSLMLIKFSDCGEAVTIGRHYS